MTDPKRFRVADADRVRRLLDGMARRVAAGSDDRLELLGVRHRGVPLAELVDVPYTGRTLFLAAQIASAAGASRCPLHPRRERGAGGRGLHRPPPGRRP